LQIKEKERGIYMGSVRAIQRNKVKNIVGKNKNVRKFWQRLMIKKKGIIAYLNEYNRTTRSNKSITDVYYS
jgi:hypothetical protein